MSRVNGRDNAATELRLICIFREHGITGWQRRRTIFGNPDFVFPKRRLAIFVGGCFWHGCPVHATRPATNRVFWDEKLARNKARDHVVNRQLRNLGWRVLRIWQHELRESGEVAWRIVRALARGPKHSSMSTRAPT